MIEICKQQECVGCAACLSACSHGAISMQPDEMGFLYPQIDQSICVDCGLCAKSCFNNSDIEFQTPLSTWVGHAKSKDEQLTSTSGGMASAIARRFLENKGVVYGSSGIDSSCVKHIRIEKLEDLHQLKGSKYVQSFMGMSYKCVVQDLKSGINVLFIGTPCQVAGLKAYLKNRIYENLYTIDFVCHGVPSQQLLNDAIHAKTCKMSNLTLVNRVKNNHGHSKYTVRLLHSGKVVYDQSYPSMGYITGFLTGLYYRLNCYHCKFAKSQRVSDITLGDFWDKSDLTKLPGRKNGLSMITVNSSKGENLIRLCDNNCVLKEWDYDDLINRNHQLKHPIPLHPHRELFKTNYQTKGFDKALKLTLKADLRRIRKNIFLNSLKDFLLKVPLGKFIFRKK